jgi:capsular polysaccharide export protein
MVRGTEGHIGGALPEKPRHFLLLQGPCGPFFARLQNALIGRGHRCTRVVFNGGDLLDARFGRRLVYWRSLADWPAWIAAAAMREGATDLVVYGDCRPYHRLAIAQLKPLGLRIHVLEEGYLRPNWITCEADGVNGNSAFADLDLDSVGGPEIEFHPPDDEVQIRGSHYRYMLAGFLYYFWTALLTPLFPRYVSHRDLEIAGEAVLWVGRILSWPIRRSRTARALRAIQRLDRPMHLVLLQLNGDSQIKEHSPFSSVRHFVEFCIAEFAASRSADSVLVFKNHPLDNGVVNLARLIREESRRRQVADRVFFVETGKLVPLLERSISATATNSTACHQALRRGVPTMALGRAVFNHPQIVARMRLADFFRLRPRKDIRHYDKLVNLLRRTCQVNGGFYSGHGRETLLPALTDLMIGEPASLEAFRVAASASSSASLAS